MISRKKGYGDDSYDADAMDRIRNVVYALVIAAAVVWLGPLMLGIDGGAIKDCGDLSDLKPLELCAAPDGKVYRINGDATGAEPADAGGEDLAGTVMGAMAETKSVLAAGLDVVKFALLAAAVASITIMRVGTGPAKTPRSRRAGRP